MRPNASLVHTRTRVRPRYALMPLEGFPASRLPSWPDCEAFVLASPALGAAFVQILMHVPSGKGRTARKVNAQTFGFLLEGAANVTIGDNATILGEEGFFFVPEQTEWSLTATADAKVLLLKKKYEANGTDEGPSPSPLAGHVADVPKEAWGGSEHGQLQTLIPDDITFDMAMNIFTFDPGYGLPIVETHVMEHGLYFLQGKGVYFLGDEWMEVEKDDFIWMGPFCPQSFYATGPTPARYLYYKNVNREIPLV